MTEALIRRSMLREVSPSHRCGILHICHDKPSFEAGSRVSTLLQQGGLERRPVTPDEIRTIEPALQGKYYGGFFTPSDATGDIHKFTRGLAEACTRRGARFIHEANVDTIVSEKKKISPSPCGT